MATFLPEEALPLKVKIGGELYSVEWFDEGTLKAHDGEPCMGSAEPDLHKIKLERGQSIQALFDTVRHELTHMGNNTYGISDGMLEEEFTDRTTKAWNDLWVQNPKLVVWFSKMARLVRKLK